MNTHVKPMTLIKEIDYGTPHVESHTMVTLEIDGREITVPEGTSIMNAAMQLGVQVPKLCASDNLEPFGSCRLCLVEIEGRKGTPASCTTPVAPGIKVTTQNQRLAKLRKGVMELYISDHPLDCLTCAANGDCELQDMAGAVGLREVQRSANASASPDLRACRVRARASRHGRSPRPPRPDGSRSCGSRNGSGTCRPAGRSARRCRARP